MYGTYDDVISNQLVINDEDLNDFYLYFHSYYFQDYE
jgi:hypothetical protein